MKIHEYGTYVKIKPSVVKWYSDNADEIYGYPEMIQGNEFTSVCTGHHWKYTAAEQAGRYFVDKYSYIRNLDMHGIIIDHSEDTECYLICYGNELGLNYAWFEETDFTKEI